MKDELKPCPFCGGEGRINTRTFSDADADVGNSYIECIECGVETPWRLTESEAIAAWNRRAIRAPMSEDALVEIGGLAVAREVQGPHFDPHTDPEGFDFACDIVRAVIAAIEPQIAAKAREDERAAVVAWLRDRWANGPGTGHDLWFADAIERGEHRENGDG